MAIKAPDGANKEKAPKRFKKSISFSETEQLETGIHATFLHYHQFEEGK